MKQLRILGDKEKHCPKCNTTKPKALFDKDTCRRDGYTGLCKDCRRQNAARWNKNNPEKLKTPIKYLGCSREHFLKHLESKFRDGMTWDNYATVWQV